MHGTTNTEHGLMSVTGLRTNIWLENHFDGIPVIEHVGDMQIVVTGAHGTIMTPLYYPEYHDGVRLIAMSAESFLDGVADVPPMTADAQVVVINVDWRSGNEFSLRGYAFKIVR